MSETRIRTCFNCNNMRICFVFRDIMESTKGIKVNIDGKAAPGKWADVFGSMANCCIEYKPNN